VPEAGALPARAKQVSPLLASEKVQMIEKR
jgi:hypothetical protein